MLYFKVVFTIVLIVATLGFAVPMAISQTDTALVLLGLGILALVPFAIYSIWSNEIGQITTQIDKGNDTTTNGE